MLITVRTVYLGFTEVRSWLPIVVLRGPGTLSLECHVDDNTPQPITTIPQKKARTFYAKTNNDK